MSLIRRACRLGWGCRVDIPSSIVEESELKNGSEIFYRVSQGKIEIFKTEAKATIRSTVRSRVSGDYTYLFVYLGKAVNHGDRFEFEYNPVLKKIIMTAVTE